MAAPDPRFQRDSPGSPESRPRGAVSEASASGHPVALTCMGPSTRTYSPSLMRRQARAARDAALRSDPSRARQAPRATPEPERKAPRHRIEKKRRIPTVGNASPQRDSIPFEDCLSPLGRLPAHTRRVGLRHDAQGLAACLVAAARAWTEDGRRRAREGTVRRRHPAPGDGTPARHVPARSPDLDRGRGSLLRDEEGPQPRPENISTSLPG